MRRHGKAARDPRSSSTSSDGPGRPRVITSHTGCTGPTRGGRARARLIFVTVLGAVFLPQLPPERLRSVVRAAEESGLEELWLWEDCFRESGIATASAALAWSERL